MGLVTWNARGLLCFDDRKRGRKIRFLEELSDTASAIGLQEVHDTEEKFRVLTQSFNKHFVIFIFLVAIWVQEV